MKQLKPTRAKAPDEGPRTQPATSSMPATMVTGHAPTRLPAAPKVPKVPSTSAAGFRPKKEPTLGKPKGGS